MPALGAWASADPLAVHAPGQADLNLYAYVHGQLLRAIDPTGLDDKTPAPAAGTTPAAPPVPGSPAAAGESAKAIGQQYGTVLGEAERMMSALTTRVGGVAPWDRMSADERAGAIGAVITKLDSLPTVGPQASAAHAAAAQKGFEDGIGVGIG